MLILDIICLDTQLLNIHIWWDLIVLEVLSWRLAICGLISNIIILLLLYNLHIILLLSRFLDILIHVCHYGISFFSLRLDRRYSDNVIFIIWLIRIASWFHSWTIIILASSCSSWNLILFYYQFILVLRLLIALISIL